MQTVFVPAKETPLARRIDPASGINGKLTSDREVDLRVDSPSIKRMRRSMSSSTYHRSSCRVAMVTAET